MHSLADARRPRAKITHYFSPQDEIHSRLRFTHRGIVACANRNEPHTNNSQFFITLDRCPWLDRKHTIFGKVEGDTVYNLARLNDIEVDEDERPVGEPPRVLSVSAPCCWECQPGADKERPHGQRDSNAASAPAAAVFREK